jgi:hypothetical protein
VTLAALDMGLPPKEFLLITLIRKHLALTAVLMCAYSAGVCVVYALGDEIGRSTITPGITDCAKAFAFNVTL